MTPLPAFRGPETARRLANEPEFRPERHLQLEAPERTWTLEDFGYSDEEIIRAVSPLAVTAPFRVLSTEGVLALREAIAGLCDQTRSNERIARYIRGGLYRSRFVRDLCLSPEVNAFMSQIAGTGLLPHPMALYQGHINLKPVENGRDVDRWHTDTVAMDYVVLLTDREAFSGGHFEYLQCTKSRAVRSLIREEEQPHVVKVDFPAAGWGILQQGNLVMHRASAVTRGAERTTFVQSFIPDSPDFQDVSRLDDCRQVDPHEILFTEWSRYKAFLSKRRLEKLMETIPYTTDRNLLCNELRRAIRDVEEAILEISDTSPGRLSHYGQDALTDPG